MTVFRNRSTWDLKEEKVSMTLMETRMRNRPMTEGELARMSPSMLATIDTALRVPESADGTCYHMIAAGKLTVDEGVRAMDQRGVERTRYADLWLEQVRVERAGVKPPVDWIDAMARRIPTPVVDVAGEVALMLADGESVTAMRS